MSYFNRIKEVEIQLPDIHGGMGGEWKFETFKGFEFPRGSGNVYEYPFTRRVALDWFPNLITDGGLEMYGAGNGGMTYCQVGTDDTPPVYGNSNLGGYVAGTVSIDNSVGAQGSAPYYGWMIRQYRFSPNFGGGDVNLNEVGASQTEATGSLSSHALTVDGLGDPATVPVLEEEYLDVYYKRRNYPAHMIEATGVPTDDQGIIDVAGIDYEYTIRPSRMTIGGNPAQSTTDGWGTGINSSQVVANGYQYHNYAEAVAHDETAVLGSVAGVPTGATDPNGLGGYAGQSAYTPGSLSRELWYQFSATKANFGVGIGGLVVKQTLSCYQLVFDNPIPKILGQAFTYYHNFSWDRKDTWV